MTLSAYEKKHRAQMKKIWGRHWTLKQHDKLMKDLNTEAEKEKMEEKRGEKLKNKRLYKGRGADTGCKGHVLRDWISRLLIMMGHVDNTISIHDSCEDGGLGLPFDTCIYCKHPTKTRTPTEHLYPSIPDKDGTGGGHSGSANVAYCCGPCNEAKGNKTTTQLIEEYPNSTRRFGYGGIINLEWLQKIDEWVTKNKDSMIFPKFVLNPTNEQYKRICTDDIQYDAECLINGEIPKTKLEMKNIIAERDATIARLMNPVRSPGAEPVV